MTDYGCFGPVTVRSVYSYMTVPGHYDDRFPQVGLGLARVNSSPVQSNTVQSRVSSPDTNMTNCKIKNRRLLVSMVFMYPESWYKKWMFLKIFWSQQTHIVPGVEGRGGADESRNVDRKTPPVPVFCHARSSKNVPAKSYPLKVVKRFWEITWVYAPIQ